MGNEASQQLELRASSLMTKILLKSEEQVIQHLTEEQIELNRSINQMGDKIAHYAAYKSMYRLLDWLIQKDANFDTVYNHRRLSPIDVAVPQTREWIYKKLKEYQVIKNQKLIKPQKSNKLSQKTSIQGNDLTSPMKNNPTDLSLSSPSISPIKQQRVQSEKNSEKNSNPVQNKEGEQRKESINFASILFNNKQ